MIADRVERSYLLIGGRPSESASGETYDDVDPSTGNVFAVVARGGEADIDRAVDDARRAFDTVWGQFPPVERGRILYRIAQLVREDADELALLESTDTGKPLRQARSDVEGAARFFEFYAGLADKIMGDTIPLEPGYTAYTVREPLGVSGQIVPWNYPIQISSRGVAPALAAGNAVVLKPASEAPLTPVRLGELALKAGLPPGVLNVIPGPGSTAGARLVSHPGVSQITFTGSVETGIAVMKLAADSVLPTVVELGGKSPNIIFADADVDAAAAAVARAIFQNAGQSCSAGSRLLVERSAQHSLLSALTARADGMILGPGVEDPDMGPLISEAQMDRVMAYIQVGRDEGARIVAGGDRPADARLRNGYYVAPTVFADARNEMRIAQEEIFGPVLTVIPFDGVDEAISLANQTQYGLVAGVWTRDVYKAHYLSAHLRSGEIFVNNYGGGRAELPFGGYKKSGFGRERGVEALASYTQTKAVCIKYA